MKNFLYTVLAIILFTPVLTWAIPSSIDRITNHIEPLIKTDYIKATNFVASSTSATSSFPVASSTTFCLSADCRTAWPSGGGTGSNWDIVSGGLETATTTDFARAAYFVATNTNATSTFAGAVGISGRVQFGTTTSALANNIFHVVAGGASLGLKEEHLAPKAGYPTNSDYILVGESANAVISLASASAGGHGSGIELIDMANATLTDKWWLGRETSGIGAGSTGNSDFTLYYSQQPSYLGTSTVESRYLTMTNSGNLGIGYSLPEARLHTMSELSDNKIAFKATQQDTVNNPRAAYIVNEGTGLGLELDQNGNGVGLSVDVSSTNVAGLRVQNTSAVRTGTGAASLFYLLNDEPTGSGDVFTLRQDAGSKALIIDDNGAGLSFEVDKDVTNTSQTGATGHSFRITNTNEVNNAATYTKSGSIFSVTSNVTETSGTITDSAILLDLNQSHADATGNIIDIDTAGTGIGIKVDGSGTGYSAIFNNGNVGIGTTTPSEKLTVVGTTTTTGLSIASLTGFLKATAGAVSTALVNLASDVTGTLGVGNGGTGLTSTGASSTILSTNGTNPVWVGGNTLCVAITGSADLCDGGDATGGGGGGGDSVLSRTAGGLIYTPTTTDSLAIGLSATTTNSRLEVNGTTTATVLVASSSIYSSSTASSTISNLIVNWFQVATDWVRGLFGSGLGRDENGDLAIVSRTDKRYNPQQITPTNHYSLDSGWSDWYLNGTTTHDATDYIDGTASMKLELPSSGALTGMRLNITDVNMSNQTFKVWMKSSNWAGIDEADILISTEGSFTSFYKFDASNWLVSPKDNEWIQVTFTLSDLELNGTPNLATANDLIIRGIANVGTTSTLWIDGFSTYERTGASGGLVSITFDDANDSQFTTAEPYLDKYGYKGTFYIIPEEINTGGSMTQAQVETLHDQGHEVAMHGATNLSTFSLADLQTELNEIKAYQIRYGFSDNFSYPNGAYNDQIREEVSKRFSSSRNISFLKNNPGYIDPYYINAVSMSSSTATSTLTDMIDEAIANDEWLILNFHDIVTSASAETQLNTSKYQAVIDYLNTTGVNVMPVEQVLARTYEQLSIHQFDNGTNANAGTLWHGDGTWGYQTLRPRNFVEFLDDYLAEISTAGNAVWVESIAGTGASCTQSTLTSNADLGISSCTTGTTATGRAGLVTDVGSMAFGGGTTTYESRLRPENASNGTDRYQLYAGFWDTTTVNQVDGAYFLYDEGGVTTGSTATTSWQCVTASNSTRTFTNSGIPVSVGSGMTKLTVEVNPAGNSVKFYVNQTLACTHTTNIPTTTTRVVGSGVNIVKSVGTTARLVRVDYQYMNRWFNTAR